jgi:hypothetical protein
VLAQACDLDPSKLPPLPLIGAHAGAPAGPEADAADDAAAAANLQLDSSDSTSAQQQQQQRVVHDEVRSEFTPAPDPLQELLAGQVRCVEYSGGRVFVDAPRCSAGSGRVYLPGSFNPLHEGHKAMLAAAVQLAGPGAEGCFELTVQNADKVGCLARGGCCCCCCLDTWCGCRRLGLPAWAWLEMCFVVSCS